MGTVVGVRVSVELDRAKPLNLMCSTISH
jgi:hypothetical protein